LFDCLFGNMLVTCFPGKSQTTPPWPTVIHW